MEKLPQELLDDIFLRICDTEQPITERFDKFTKSSIRTALNCRLVACRWFESQSLIRVFIGILANTPFVWCNHRLPVLEEISEIPKYTRWLSTNIAICGMDLGLVTLGAYDRWGAGRDEFDKEYPVTQYLVHLLRRLSWVEHFIFYYIHPNCLDGTWPKWDVTNMDRASFETCFQGDDRRNRYGYPALTEGEHSWWGVQLESGWIFPKIMEAFEESHLWLESVSSPLFGNRASYCAISTGGDLPSTNSHVGLDLFKWFPIRLKHIAITITRPVDGTWSNLDCLEYLINLEYLEITLSKNQEELRYDRGPFGAPYFGVGLWSPVSGAWYRLEKLKEFRLMADYQHSFLGRDILTILEFFPNLEKLALGRILITNGFGGRSSLLQKLAPFNLRELWLLDPRNLVCNNYPPYSHLTGPPVPHASQNPTIPIDGTHNTDFHMVKYVEDKHLLAAAQKVRLIDTGTLWIDEGYAHPPLRRDFEYSGFAVFEQSGDDG